MKATKIISLASMAIGITVAASTHADNQFVAALYCQPQENPYGTPQYGSGGRIQNAADVALAVYCPIDRTAFGPEGSMAVKVFAHDYNADPDEDVCCTAIHRNAGGSSYSASGYSCTSSSGEYQSIDLTIPSHAGTWDYAILHCWIPGVSDGNKSAIIAYRGVEQ